MICYCSLKKIDDSIKIEVDEAVKKAREDKETDVNELSIDVYANNLEGNIRNILQRNLKHSNVGVRLIPAGTVKATPKSEIKEIKQEKPETKLTNEDQKKKEQKTEIKKEVKGETTKPDGATKF